MKLLAQFPLVLPLILTTGCATTVAPDSADEVGAPIEAPAEVQKEAPAGRTSMSISELEGTWEGGCVYFDPEEPDEGYQRTTFTFSGNTFRSNTIVYSESSCSVVLERGFLQTGSSLQSAGEVSSPAGSVNTSVGAVPFIDIAIAQYTIDNKPITGAFAAMFAAETQYDIAHIQGGTLYLGDISGAMDGSTVGQRPVEIDVQRAFVKR